MIKSSCLICEIDLENSYGVIISLAIVNKNGKHKLITDKKPSHVICEKCWEVVELFVSKEDYVSEILKLV